MKPSRSSTSQKSNVIVNGKRKPTNAKKTYFWKDMGSQKLWALLTVLVFGGIGVYLIAHSFAATPSPTPTAQTATFNVTSWNSAFSNKTNVGKSIKALAVNSDIVGVQETHKPSQRKNIKSQLLCSTCRYAGYVQNYSHSGSSPASTPILWNKAKFDLVKKGYYQMSKRVTNIKDSSKGKTVSAKYITWVKLRDKATASSFYVLNLHTVASVEKGGSPNTKNKTRLKLYAQEMKELVKRVNAFKKTGLPIIVIGDFNVNYRYDAVIKNSQFPYKQLGALGLHSSFERLGQISADPTLSTHGTDGRVIDYIFTLTHSRMSVNDEYIDAGTYGSDHHPITAAVTVYTGSANIAQQPVAIPIGTANPETGVGIMDETKEVQAEAF